ncbi:hypothetical protein [Flavihumibacter sp. CACIAM 22H1]|uniref:hypothetical protein n=1 Tax=Flavihumibacter sp. CACIAM 22H1 TaxID=1812911 RepID=UPI0007A7F37A|nr:hypothetical protein [Flavihumibacter sp. CACIAM 22H1]KYP14145.1 MAG: hypothetical protein A1D16_20040 [Flavihumibacter sp. CACIAM 22H1]
MPEKILKEDWSDYDNKKKKWVDRFFFSCEEVWEIDYLVSKIRKVYPSISETAIRTAIASCCKEVPANRPREKFVRCVMSKL